MSKQEGFKKAFILIGFALFVKIVMVSYIVHQAKQEEKYKNKFITSFVLKSNDYGYFLQPVENYFKEGVMYYANKDTPFAGRMPGYWFPYLVIRFFFNAAVSINILISLQILMAALSVYYLAKTAFNIYKTTFSFYFVYVLFLVTPYILSHDITTQTESFAVSASILELYFLSEFFYNGQRKYNLVLSGAFLAWAIFLRPFVGLSILLIPLLLIVYSVRHNLNWGKTISYVMLFCSVFIIFETLWVYRNYRLFKRVILLETPVQESYGKLYSDAWEEIVQMIVTFGEQSAYFEPRTLAEWFREPSGPAGIDDSVINPEIFNNVSFNKDSLVVLKSKYHAYMQETDSAKEQELADYCINISKRYAAEYKQKNYFKVQFLYPVKRFRQFIFNSGSSYLLLPSFADMSWHQKIVKIAASTIYYITVCLGFIGIVLVCFKNKFGYLNVLLITSSFLLILFMVFFSEIQENRYFMPIYPCFALLCVEAVSPIKKMIVNRTK